MSNITIKNLSGEPITTIRTEVGETQDGKTEMDVLSSLQDSAQLKPTYQNVIETVASHASISNEAWHKGGAAEAERMNDFIRERRESLMREIPINNCTIYFSNVCYSRRCRKMETEGILSKL